MIECWYSWLKKYFIFDSPVNSTWIIIWIFEIDDIKHVSTCYYVDTVFVYSQLKFIQSKMCSMFNNFIQYSWLIRLCLFNFFQKTKKNKNRINFVHKYAFLFYLHAFLFVHRICQLLLLRLNNKNCQRLTSNAILKK